MIDILIDTSFILEISSKPVIGFEDIESTYGKIRFVILKPVLQELENMASGKRERAARKARVALDFASRQIVANYSKGVSVDDKMLNYARERSTPVATLDRELMRRLRNYNVPILTLSKNRLRAEGVFIQAKPS